MKLSDAATYQFLVGNTQEADLLMPTFSRDGINLAYTDTGPRDGLPIVLLHAFPLRGEMWQSQAEALVNKLGCRVIVPDLRGFGASDAPPGPYTMNLYAADVLGLVDHLKIPRFILGGLSMGGYITFALIRQAAERIQGIILADTKASEDSDAVRSGREEQAIRAETEGTSVVANLMLPRLLSPRTLANRPDLVAETRSMIEKNKPTGIAGAARGMALRPDSTPALTAIKCPTLVLVGEYDTTTPIAEAKAMFSQLTNGTFSIIDGAAHISTIEAPEKVSDAMVHFVSNSLSS
jgi:3-oxoadipate enol-lactonase